MSIWIRKVSGDKSKNHLELGKDSWELQHLFTEFENWLQDNASELEEGSTWIADIGFSPRQDATGGGPIISTDLMRTCVEKNISIYLSEYDDLE